MNLPVQEIMVGPIYHPLHALQLLHQRLHPLDQSIHLHSPRKTRRCSLSIQARDQFLQRSLSVTEAVVFGAVVSDIGENAVTICNQGVWEEAVVADEVGVVVETVGEVGGADELDRMLEVEGEEGSRLTSISAVFELG